MKEPKACEMLIGSSMKDMLMAQAGGIDTVVNLSTRNLHVLFLWENYHMLKIFSEKAIPKFKLVTVASANTMQTYYRVFQLLSTQHIQQTLI